MSKKLFAALSLSVLLAACQGSVTPPADDAAMDADDAAMMDDTAAADDTMMDETSSDSTVEVDVDAGAAAGTMAQ